MPHDYDVVIVGAGMVGASLACAIAPTNLSIALIEPVLFNDDQQPSYDDRGISLSPSSKRILEHIGIWQSIYPNATPIKKIHISNQKKFGFTHFAASDALLISVIPFLGKCVMNNDPFPVTMTSFAKTFFNIFVVSFPNPSSFL